ncbi:MAG: hypothetical protein ACXVAX_14005 [Pseudobdellovibrio sp.]
MSKTRLEHLRNKAKFLQKAKKKSGKPIQLKEAFNIIAKASGFGSWQDLKETLDANEVFCPHGHSSIWKTWYSSYEQAVHELKKTDGYLLPYVKDFFICDQNYLSFLGVDPQSSLVKEVGRNWVEPQSTKALQEVIKLIKAKKN